MRYLLDSNHASPLVTLTHPLRQRILESVASDNLFFIALPVVTEVLFGIGMLPRARANLEIWQLLQKAFTVLGLTKDDAEFAARIQIEARSRGRQIATVDALIAAVALRDDLILLTTDKDFNAIPNLHVENWLV